jgi:hypothetical protein
MLGLGRRNPNQKIQGHPEIISCPQGMPSLGGCFGVSNDGRLGVSMIPARWVLLDNMSDPLPADAVAA